MIIVILIIILIILIIFPSGIEGYDVLLSNKTFDECGGICKTTADCYGFAYKQNKDCYLAWQPIERDYIIPSEFQFVDAIKEEDVYCNKAYPIEFPNDTPSFAARRTNAIYTCTHKERADDTFLHNQCRMNRIEAGENPSFLTEIDFYRVH